MPVVPRGAGCGARIGTVVGDDDFVVDETLTLVRSRLGLRTAAAWWQQIDGSARVRWERIDHVRFERGRQLFFQYDDKDLSFTDCTSFALMRELKLTPTSAESTTRRVASDVPLSQTRGDAHCSVVTHGAPSGGDGR